MYQLELFLKNIYWHRFSGEFFSSKRWDGYDLEDFREYQIWDNIKKINWKLSAKYDKEYVSIYKQEKEPVVDVFIDLNENTLFFRESLEKLLSLLDMMFKNLWIKKNIYTFEKKWFFKKKLEVKFYKDCKSIKLNTNCWAVSSINEIIKSKEFKNKENYKLIVSDFIFLEDVWNFIQFYKKIFFVSVPLLTMLNNGSFPVLNWYFDKFLNRDLLQEYKEKLEKLRLYGWIEIID